MAWRIFVHISTIWQKRKGKYIPLIINIIVKGINKLRGHMGQKFCDEKETKNNACDSRQYQLK